ncbi:MAG TPA: metallophosphoesterase [Gemmataceae bacterium]|jgi:predicted phosphodiesterase|nr:metallophosphoesterase [Gemmataceae bacterium]
MKRILLLTATVVLIAGALAFSGATRPIGGGDDVKIAIEDRNPWTNLQWNNAAETFHFAIVSDRTGGHRARVFSQAVDQLNMLQPSFVVSVGDLIEGYTKDKEKLDKQWKEMQGYVAKLQMPFFYVPGNHDVSNPTEVEHWKGRFGRRYYHFLYRDVLFCCLATDDQGEDEKTYGSISKEQVDYFTEVLKDNPKVRWTIVIIHKPVWAIEKAKIEGFLAIEKALSGRNYTVFAGHVHRFEKFVRGGMNYYQLATTGGGSKMRGLPYREFDHITWVTMKAQPMIAHVMLDGILPEDLKRTPTAEDGVIVFNRKQAWPVRGKVLIDGAPAAGATIAFHQDVGKNKGKTIADALVEADGTYILSSREAWDGAPAGKYQVTVVLRNRNPDGSNGPHQLPAKYASVATSELTAEVVAEVNNFDFNLKRE